MRILHYIVLLFILSILSCQQRPTAYQTNQLGEINFEVTGNKEALPSFEKGLLLLHSFEYSDARKAFLEAQALDPSMAIAYWGEAMTYNHGLWNEQDYEEGKAVLERLHAKGNTKVISAVEKDFIRAIEVLYQEEKSKIERDKAYANFMEALHQKYPQNQEIAAFYALALLSSVEEGRDYDIYGKGALVAKGILSENPNHPGALHYTIHAYDDPDHAHLALEVADSYADVAPDASHALHMPSHIYVALGMWDQVVKSNERSYQASVNKMEREGLTDNARGYHAYHWLQYGYLQQARVEEAQKMALSMVDYTKDKPTKRAKTHLVFLKGTYLVDTDDWDSEVADIYTDVSDLNISIRSQYQFLDGMKAFHSADANKIEEAFQAIKADYEQEVLIVKTNKIAVCANVSREMANQTDINGAKTREYQLRGLKAWLEGDNEQTEYWLKEAVAMENGISYSFGPPFIQKPSHELYAEWLLSEGRLEEALEQYDLTLKKAPKRRKALEGKKQVAEEMKNQPLVKEIDNILTEITFLSDIAA